MDLDKIGKFIALNRKNNDGMYLEKSLIYNSVSIFSLIENVEYIEYNFSGSSYKITRQTVEDNYPNYSAIVLNEKIDKEKFNELVENKMNDNEFVEQIFQKFGFKLTNNLKD